MKRPVRLLTTSLAIRTVPRARDELYDSALGYSIAPTPDGFKPVAVIATAAGTMSKTAQAPGDDDEDPDREVCY